MTAMMEKMLKDPNMQKMLYPYLPEPMRNPESIEWMLNNPEVRKQMEGVFAQSVSTPGMIQSCRLALVQNLLQLSASAGAAEGCQCHLLLLRQLPQ